MSTPKAQMLGGGDIASLGEIFTLEKGASNVAYQLENGSDFVRTVHHQTGEEDYQE